MATNILPHNLGEVIDACIAVIDNPALTIEELNHIIPGPDFPTGGLILGRAGIRSGYHTGRGSVVMRGKVEIVTIRKDREAIIVTEIPTRSTRPPWSSASLSNWCARSGSRAFPICATNPTATVFRVVVELKRDAMPDVVLNQLYRFTPLQTNFGVNMVALDSTSADDEPEGPADDIRRFPRAGGDAADQVSAQQGARPRPHPVLKRLWSPISTRSSALSVPRPIPTPHAIP